jgi:hypothetical protein
MHIRPLNFARYGRKAAFSLGIRNHMVDVHVSESFWSAIPHDDSAYWEEFSHALQGFIFCRERRVFDGRSEDPVNTLRFHKTGNVRSGIFETTYGLVAFVMYHNRGKFHVNINLMQMSFGIIMPEQGEA